MNAEDKIKEMNDEIRAIKTMYAQSPLNLITYTYEEEVGSAYLINQTLTIDTEDGSNAIATIEGATYRRLPYEGGAQFYLKTKLGNDTTVKLHSMQKGTVTLS